MISQNISKKSQIISVGTAAPKSKYTQSEIAKLFNIQDEKSLRFFQHEHIKTRHLCSFNKEAEKNNSELIQKFKKNAVELSTEAILKALNKAQLSHTSIDYICCVTSTGFIVPSLSLLISEKINLNSSCRRTDLVGMGCSAGINGLETVDNWCTNNPTKYALLVCCEISSAAYTDEQSEENALVNSLFGDGVAAVILNSGVNLVGAPSIIKYSSYRVGKTLENLKYNWNQEKNLNQFYVSKETPKILGTNIKAAISQALGQDYSVDQINHWVLHTGGAAILDNIVLALGIESTKIKNTREVLQKYGNLSSGSFLFSYELLLNEEIINKDDLGIMITMGPGLVIEIALIKW